MKSFLAIDIGASSGRHIVGYEDGGELVTREVYRFENRMDECDGHLVWNVSRLLAEVKEGIRRTINEFPEVVSMSIDTWGVDYVLMRGDEEILPVYAYRDGRTESAIGEVHKIIPHEELYRRTGIQYMSFNSIYQLYADKAAGRLDGVTDFLMMPEYLMYKLTGKKIKEYTNATTGSIVNAATGEIDREIFERLGLPTGLIAPLYMPGELIGGFTDEVRAEVGGNIDVVLCATHDTASAVEAIEMEENAPYISSGTWSLLGVKTPAAITDEASRASGYSNEGGVGYNRYQINITGMWIIQSLRRELCPETSYAEIEKMAVESEYKECFNVNDEVFLSPASMSDAIKEQIEKSGRKTPEKIADYFSAAYVSLAKGYERAICDLERNTGRTYGYIYIVGGGAKNTYLNELTEAATGKRVIALPIEATAIGNLRAQMKRFI